jgi:hypothetical protein
MKNCALSFSALFTLCLLAGTYLLLTGYSNIGGFIMILSSFGATASLLLYDDRIKSPGSIAKYKWQDDLIKLTTITITGLAFIFLVLC